MNGLSLIRASADFFFHYRHPVDYELRLPSSVLRVIVIEGYFCSFMLVQCAGRSVVVTFCCAVNFEDHIAHTGQSTPESEWCSTKSQLPRDTKEETWKTRENT